MPIAIRMSILPTDVSEMYNIVAVGTHAMRIRWSKQSIANTVIRNKINGYDYDPPSNGIIADRNYSAFH